MRRVLFWLFVVAGIYLLVTHAADIRILARTISSGRLSFVLIAAVLQVAYYALYIGSVRAAFEAVGIERPYRELVAPVIGSLFVNVVTPAGGLAGPALVIDDAGRHGHSTAAATAAALLAQIADFTAFAVVMAAGFVVLLVSGRLTVLEVVAAGLLIGLIALLAAALVLGLAKPSLLEALLRRVEGIAIRFGRMLRRPIMAEGWAPSTAEGFGRAARSAAERPESSGKALGLGFLGYCADLLSLFALGVAFGWSNGWGGILAAYAVGVLFWIVSPVPQGIGIVEGAMSVTLASFGAPVSQAATIALTFRGLSFWLPFFIGFVLLRRTKTFARATRDSSRGTAVHLAALLVAGAGVMNILSAITPALHTRVMLLERLIPLEVRYGGDLTAVIAGAGLLVLARGLWNRKRVAWGFAVGLLALSAVSHLLKGLDYEEALVALMLALWLVSLRSLFHARSDAPTFARGLGALAGATLFTLAYGTAGFYLLDRHFHQRFGLAAALRQTLVMFTQFYNPGLQPITGFGRYFAESIYIVGAVTFAYASAALLRPVLVRRPAGPAERARAAAIVREWGRSSLAAYTLLPDKLYRFTPKGSVTAYVEVRAVACVLGDPIGPPEDRDAAIEDFLYMCSRNGWTPAYYQTLPDSLDAYRKARLQAIRVGQEAVVRLADFSMEGKSRKTLRNTVHRLEGDGYHAVMHPAPQSPGMLAELWAVSEAWLAETKGVEKRFSFGWFTNEYVGSSPVMAIRDSEDRIVAFANLISEYRLNEATIDMMRHTPDAPSGVMDYLFVKLFDWAKSSGYETFNLGLSALSGLSGTDGEPVEKALNLVYEHVNTFYSFQGLHEFKDKFDPEWQDRFLVYGSPLDLPRIALALVEADSGGSGWLSGYVRGLLRR